VKIRRPNVKATIGSGLIAGAVYVVTAEIDNRITDINQDDLKMLGWLLVEDKQLAKLAGLVPHMTFSIALAGVYGVLRDSLPRRSWIAGPLLALTEGTVLYPLALLENRHEGVRVGAIDRYLTLTAYLQSLPRHLTYGLTMGVLYDRMARRT
jgi:hypothetical protein